MNRRQELESVPGLTYEDIDLAMNLAVGALESYRSERVQSMTPSQVEYLAHKVAIRIIEAHLDGEATY